ncbi:hypothetical protein [Niallia nealsonii]|uniref:hypothetical protein n=1 Tax=Niallia nealsonii TaxID=115979 RepID=UPI0012FEB615|nr:hypothetical protein [Niallia nealsonii]
MYIFHELKGKKVKTNWKDNLLANKKFEKLYSNKNTIEVLVKNIHINKNIR